MYKIIKDERTNTNSCIFCFSNGACIPFDPANTDYTNFKEQIMSDEAQMQDANGNVMTAEAAKEFVRGLL